MKILVLNASPRKEGTVATLLREVAAGAAIRHEVEWIEVYDLKMHPCLACMQCRPEGECVLPEDDAHRLGRKIKAADALIVGTPTYWSNMSAPLKMLFDRSYTVFMGDKPSGLPYPRQKGKTAAIVTACTTPWPLNVLFGVSCGAIWAVRRVLRDAGYRILGRVVKPGTLFRPQISARLLARANKLGRKF